MFQGVSRLGIYRKFATMGLPRRGKADGLGGGRMEGNISFKLSFKGMVQSMARYGFKHG